MACSPAVTFPACGRPAACSAGICREKSPYGAQAWSAAAGATVYAACGGYSLLALGAKLNGTWPGSAGWFAATHSTSASPITWSAGYAVAFEHCDEVGSGSIAALGWQQNGDSSEKDSLAAAVDDQGLGKIVHLGVAGDDQLTAAVNLSSESHLLVGERTQADSGLDVRLVYRNAQGTVNDVSLALAGDQYVRGAIDVDDEGVVLCGYQSVAGAKADGWFAGVGTDAKVKWQTLPRSPTLSASLRHCVASLAAAHLSTPRSFSSLFLDLHLKSGAARPCVTALCDRLVGAGRQVGA